MSSHFHPGLEGLALTHISQVSIGKSPRATAPSGVSDLAKCRLRTFPHRLIYLELDFRGSGLEIHSFNTSATKFRSL